MDDKLTKDRFKNWFYYIFLIMPNVGLFDISLMATGDWL